MEHSPIDGAPPPNPARRFHFCPLVLWGRHAHLAPMKPPAAPRPSTEMEWDPVGRIKMILAILGRSLTRLWGRDVMLYVGGVSFFVMLAVFPAVAILVGVYGLLADPAEASRQATVLSRLMPEIARGLFQEELTRLGDAPLRAVSAQSGLALIIGGYASHRGFKALLAGLSFIHEEERPHGFFGFNLMALVVLVAAFILLSVLSAAFLYLRFLAAAFDVRPLQGLPWLFSEWTWASLGITLAMGLIYRYAMSRKPVAWSASIAGGAFAAGLCLFMSWASAFYVEQIVQLGATYGSVTAVVVLLIWLSWNVNAVFFGGALATEIEIALEKQPELPLES